MPYRWCKFLGCRPCVFHKRWEDIVTACASDGRATPPQQATRAQPAGSSALRTDAQAKGALNDRYGAAHARRDPVAPQHTLRSHFDYVRCCLKTMCMRK